MLDLQTFSDEDLAEWLKMAISAEDEAEITTAFTAIFERQKERVTFYCRKLVGKHPILPDTPDDVFSEFFCRLNSKIQSFDASKGRFRFWMHRVLERLVLDFAARNKARREGEVLLPGVALDEFCYSEADDLPIIEAPPSVERKRLDEALKNLSDRDKAIVLEHARRRPVISSQRSPKGTLEEIAVSNGVTYENVKMIIKRFRQSVLSPAPK